MKILMILSKPFRPDVRVHNEASYLIERGHEVTLTAWDRKDEYPKRENVEGIDVRRVKLPSKKNIFFPLKLWMFWKKVYRTAKKIEFDAVHCHDLDTLYAGVKLKKKFGKPLVYDAHEIYALMTKWDVPRTVRRFIQCWENLLLRKVDKLITVSEGTKSFYVSRGMRKSDTAVVMNCKPLTKVSEEKIKTIKKRLGLEGKFVLAYIGTLEDGRFVKEMVEASKHFDEDTVLLVGGYGKYAEYVKNAVSPNLNYIGVVHPKDVLPYLKCSNAVAAVYHPSMENQNISIVTKLFDAVMAGRPIVVNKELKETAKIVQENNCGLVIPYSVHTFLSAINRLKKAPKLCGRLSENASKLRNIYNWGVMGERLSQAYESFARKQKT